MLFQVPCPMRQHVRKTGISPFGKCCPGCAPSLPGMAYIPGRDRLGLARRWRTSRAKPEKQGESRHYSISEHYRLKEFVQKEDFSGKKD